MYRKHTYRFWLPAMSTIFFNSLCWLGAAAQAPTPVRPADSVEVAASYRYSDPSLLKQIFLGKNYRQEWETPVTLPVFHLADLGLHVRELGGGKQTKSLRLVDNDSLEWALRTVDKDVRPALPKLLRNKLTLSLVQDLVSAANPYAPLTIPPLARAAGVVAASPTYYYIPKNNGLGQYADIFGGTVCLLEQRDLLPGYELKGTQKMIENLFDDHRSVLDQSAFLNARLLDMLIADWDRHYDQWKWAELDTGKQTTYLALPKDRDQAYFYSKGLLLSFIRLFGMKFSVGFTGETDNLVKLNSVALSLDRVLLNGLSKTEWQRVTTVFTRHVGDDVIRNSVRQLPPPVYAIHGQDITEKLLKRKHSIAEGVLKYYAYLAKEVSVYGTDKAEHFSLEGGADSVTVTISSNKNREKIYYQRTFLASETKRVHLLGLGGDDVFTAQPGLKTSIKFDIDGGTGKNTYELSGNKKIKAKDTDRDAKLYMYELEEPLKIRKRENK